MPEPVAGPALVAFDDGNRSAADELEALGDEVAIRFLRFLDRVAHGREDYRSLQEFTAWLGVPLFKAEYEDNVVIYAVEEDEMGDRKVTVMWCGRRRLADPAWEVIESLVKRRAAHWFSAAGA